MKLRLIFVIALAVLGASSQAVVFPTNGHAANNFIPFGENQTITMHQVFASSLFTAIDSGNPVMITGIGFAPSANQTWGADLTIRLGYTTKIPGVASTAGGLAVPTAGGGGGPNSSGSMTTFFQDPNYTVTISGAGTGNFSELMLPGSFVFDPSQGNLLVEIVATIGDTATDMSVSRAAGSAESSRAYTSTRFGSTESVTTATRMDFSVQPVPEPATMLAIGAGLAGLMARKRRRS